MEVVSIFAPEQAGIMQPTLWAVCYPEDQSEGQLETYDIFSKLFDQWNDPSYLWSFFKENIEDLNRPFWRGISVDQAIKKVYNEAGNFEEILEGVIFQTPEFRGLNISDLFEPYHESEFYFKFPKEQIFKKGRTEHKAPMLRLYGIQMPENVLLITGGAIKLTARNTSPHLQREQDQLRRVLRYMEENQIIYIEDFS
jgi:hypothetical protein